MPEIVQQSFLFRYCRSAFFLLCLAALLGCATLVVLRLPPVDRFDNSVDRPNEQILINVGHRQLQLDLTDGSLSEGPPQSEELSPLGAPFCIRSCRKQPAYAVKQATTGLRLRDYVATLTNQDEDEVDIEFQFPTHPFAMPDGLVVGAYDGQVFALDLLADPQQLNSWKWSNNGGGLRITAVSSERKFIARNSGFTLRKPTPKQTQLYLLCVDQDGAIQMLAKWPVGGSATVVSDRIYSMTPDGKQIEIRADDTGKYLGLLQLPAEFLDQQSAFSTIRLSGDLVVIEKGNEYSYYDIARRKPIQFARRNYWPAHSSYGTEPHLFFSPANPPTALLGFDLSEQKELWHYHLNSETTLASRMSDEKLVMGTDEFGLSVAVIHARTGQQLARYTPFKWLSWLSIATQVGFAVWIIAWLKYCSPRLPIWLNLTLIATIILGICHAYLANWDLLLVYYGVRYGIFSGLLISSFVWLVFGCTRITLRYTPAIAVLCLITLYYRYSLSGFPQLVIHYIYPAVLPAAWVLLATIPFRLTRVRLVSSFVIHDSASVQTHRIPLRDLFLASTCVAFLVFAAGPMETALPLPNVDIGSTITVALLVLGSIMILLTVLAKSQRWFAVGAAVTCMIFGSLVVECSYEWITASPGYWSRASPESSRFRLVATSLVTLFVVLLAYRFRGWRLSIHPRSSAQ